jgi:DNA-binding transcriptional regulator LsrR (DeoR family)
VTDARSALAYAAARLYYEGDLSQTEIAERLGVSTATVSRLLRDARELGIVTIQVRPPSDVTVLGEVIREALGLEHVCVAPTSSAAGALTLLAEPVRRILSGLRLRAGARIAIGWGQTVWEVLSMGLPAMPGVVVVPASGGMQEPAPPFQSNELARLAAHQMGGSARFLHAPYLASPSWHELLRSDPDVAAAISLWDRLELAIVGVGLPYAVDVQKGGTSVTPRGRGAPMKGAGDVVLHYFDVAGDPVPWRGEPRLVAVSRDQLRATPLVLGVAGGAVKAPGIVGAARAGLISALATDQLAAQAIVALLEDEGGAAPATRPGPA